MSVGLKYISGRATFTTPSLYDGLAVTGHLCGGCCGEAAPVGVDEVRSLPRLVADLGEVELACADDDLLAASVDRVAIGVEVGDGLPGEAFVGAEPGEHLVVGLDQPGVLQRGDVGRGLGGGDLVSNLTCFTWTSSMPSGWRVASMLKRDVLGFLRLLVRVHHERLDDGRVDDAADERDHGPQRGGDDGSRHVSVFNVVRNSAAMSSAMSASSTTAGSCAFTTV